MTPPDASDIGLEVLQSRARTLQWRVWDASLKGVPVLAWQFDPDLKVDKARLAQMRLIVATHALATAPLPASGLWPRTAGFSARSNSGWVLYPAVPSASPEALGAPGRWPQLFGALLTGLDALHQRGVLHLDVHPDHLYDHGGTVLLAGFGIDCRPALAAAAPGTRSNAGLARPLFGAPELWDASAESPLGPWTDIFAGAALMYRCLTGAPPPDFRQRRLQPDWRAALSQDIRGPLAKLGDRAPAIEAMILNGLEPAIAARPRSVAEWVGGPPAAFWPQPAQSLRVVTASAAAARTAKAAVSGAGAEASAPARSGLRLFAVAAVLAVAAAMLWVGRDRGLDAEADTADDIAAAAGDAAADAMAADYPMDDGPPADETPGAAETGSAEADLEAAAAAAAADAEAAAREIAEAAMEAAADPAPPPRPTSTASPSPPVVRLRVRPTGDTAFLVPGDPPRIARQPRLRSGAITIADFPVPPGGPRMRYGTSVRVEFTVQPSGVATDCRVVKAGPDSATNARMCPLVTSRLRFEPAQAPDGSPVAARYGWEQQFFPGG